MQRAGSQIGLFRRATILKYNGDGTVLVGLDEAGLQQVQNQFKVPIPLAWAGPDGEFIGGTPRRGASVIVSQAHGGEWFIVSYIPSNTVFDNNNSVSSSSSQDDLMGTLRAGRAVMQVKEGNRIFIDPAIGIQAGRADNFIHINPIQNIISHNFESQMGFTEAYRSVNSVIKRDLSENSNRNVLGSTLDSQIYDKSLFTIGLDPSTAVTPTTLGTNVRNPPLVEAREMVYEFANSYQFTTDSDEVTKYSDPKTNKQRLKVSRRDIRADAMSMSIEAPNQLTEKIVGTAVDTFGNIVDINRTPLPIGKIEALSFRKNVDKVDAFKKIRAHLRKSIALHFELNARKGTSDPNFISHPDVDNTSDYSRDESKLFIDIDKEGQFKINIPASSEIGNLPLLTRYENYSNLLSKKDGITNPNSFVRSSSGQDIFSKNFAGKANIKLSSSDTTLDGYEAPLDYITDKPIKYGTAFHDILNTCSEFQKNANYIKAGVKLIDFDKNNPLNTDFKPLDKIVSDTIIVSGSKANAGGRSGSINLDGFLMLNIGANTIDRQSLWLDTAGSLIGNIGRDKQGVSTALSMDGDFLLQVGGPGIGNSFDSRFAKENDAYRNGTFDIRVMVNGQLMIFRMGPQGITISSPGTITFSAQQDIILRSNSNIKMEAENILLYGETSKRLVNRFPAGTIG